MRGSWLARLELGFEASNGRTILARRRHEGPLVVQKPFHPEPDGTCHVYVLHPPGGMVPGDVLTLEVEAAAGSKVLLTTPAATKIYRSDGRTAAMQQRLAVHGDAELEWLPQETLVFDGALAEARTHVELSGTASFAGWEIVCFGRPASALPFARGRFRQRFEIHRDARPLWIERGDWPGGGEVLLEPWGLGGATCTGTFVATGAGGLVDRLREHVTVPPDAGQVACTRLGELLVARFLGHSAEVAKDTLARVWQIVREHARARPAHPPRIWKT